MFEEVNSYDKNDWSTIVKVFMILGLLVLLIHSVSGTLIENDNNVRAYYNLTGLGDATGRTGTLSTGVGSPSSTIGIIGNGYDFDGSSQDELTQAANPVPTYPLTINAWVNQSANVVFAAVAGVGDDTVFTRHIFLGVDNGNPICLVRNSAQGQATATTTITNGQWYMITCVIESGNLKKIYVNGVNEANDTTSLSYPSGVNGLSIGMPHDSNTDQQFNGIIDEVSFINKTLDQEEIDFLYANGAPGARQQYPFISDAPPIVTNITSTYATGNFSLSLTTTDLTNMSYSLNGSAFISVATNSNSATLTLSNVGVGNSSISFKSNNSDGLEYTNTSFVVQPFQYFRFNDTSTGEFVNTYTFGGVASVDNTTTLDARNFAQGVNNITFTKAGYISTTYQITFNNTMQINDILQVSPATVVVNIRDKDNFNLITGENFTMDFIGTTGFTATTTTGTESITGLLASGTYDLFVTSENYTSEFAQFTFNNQENLNVSVYTILTNGTSTGFVTLEVIDVDGEGIGNAVCTARQWNSATSSYVQVSQGKTTDNGKTNLNVILNNKQYIFRCSKGGSTVDSVAQVISTSDNGKTITLTLSAGTGAPFKYIFQDINYNATNSLNSTTNISTVTFSWNNRAGTDVTACVNGYRVQAGSEVLLSAGLNCTSAVSGDIIRSFDVNTTYDLYLLKAEFLQGGEYYPVETFRIYSENSIWKQFENYGIHYFILIFLHLVSIMAGLTVGNIMLGSSGLIISSLAVIAMVPTLMTTSVALFLTFVGIITIVGGNR